MEFIDTLHEAPVQPEGELTVVTSASGGDAMKPMDFVSRFNELLSERRHGGLRAGSVSKLPTLSVLLINSDDVLAPQRLAVAMEDEDLRRLVQSWERDELLLSIRGPGRDVPRPAILVRGGELFNVSGAAEFDLDPEFAPSFADWFHLLVGAPSPIALELIPLEKNVWGSASARGHAVGGFPHTLKVRALHSYDLVGFAGYGINSYALYVTRVSGDTRMYLRLGWGGAYMDAETARPKLLANLEEANGLFEIAARKRLPLRLNNNMGRWHSETRSREESSADDRPMWNLDQVREYVNTTEA